MAHTLDVLTAGRKEMRELMRNLGRQPEVLSASTPVRTYRPPPPPPSPIRRYPPGMAKEAFVYSGALTLEAADIVFSLGNGATTISITVEGVAVGTAGDGTFTVKVEGVEVT